MRIAPSLALLAMAVACSLLTGPAQAALRDRVFVASYGSDSNPCTFGSPCKTFQNALNAVAPGGEITAIDSAGFGPVFISQAVTITSPNGVEAGIAAAAGGNAVTIQAGLNDTVVLSGLTLEGAQSGTYGVYFAQGARLEIVNCTIRNYTTTGINFVPEASAVLNVTNTVISDNAGYGISLNPDEAGSSITAALNNVTINNNGTGVLVYGAESPIEVSITNSHIDNNLSTGVDAIGFSSNLVSVILKAVTLNQTNIGISVESNASVWLSRVTQTSASGFSSTGVNITGSNNAVYTDNTNHLMGAIVGNLTAWPPQ